MVRARLVGLDQGRLRDSDERDEKQRDGRQGLDKRGGRRGQSLDSRANWRNGEAESF